MDDGSAGDDLEVGYPKGSWKITPGETSCESVQLGDRIGTLFLLDRVSAWVGMGGIGRIAEAVGGDEGEGGRAVSVVGPSAGNLKLFMAAE